MGMVGFAAAWRCTGGRRKVWRPWKGSEDLQTESFYLDLEPDRCEEREMEDWRSPGGGAGFWGQRQGSHGTYEMIPGQPGHGRPSTGVSHT